MTLDNLYTQTVLKVTRTCQFFSISVNAHHSYYTSMLSYLSIGCVFLSGCVYVCAISRDPLLDVFVDTYTHMRKSVEKTHTRICLVRNALSMSHEDLNYSRPFCDAVGVIPETIAERLKALPLGPTKTSKWTLKSLIEATHAPEDTHKIVIYYPPSFVIDRSIASSVYIRWDMDRVEFA